MRITGRRLISFTEVSTTNQAAVALMWQVSALGRMVPGSDPIPLKIRRVWGLCTLITYVVIKRHSRCCGVEVWRRGASSGVVSSSDRVQTEVRPKITLVLLQKGR
ncbi:hypothetical protein AVEN_153903-1 [Araneus ventricosus]|uniref:Uncharacterized protein n=1 Tax=Araneus ventricosus TaxID=182803 RepID=A0A4Y2F5X0_ARAVE|nr:hypothetical protein AVEN_153903-1 [Araneus ventricosus]